MNIIRNILVPVNFSKSSKNAVKTAIAMCKRHDAELHLMHIVDTEQLIPTAGMNIPLTGLEDKMIYEITQKLRQYAHDISTAEGVVCHTYCDSGFVPYAISEKAKDLRADLIVIGGRNRNSISNLLPGNTAYNVVKQATQPVLIVPATSKSIHFKNILMPVRPILNISEKYEFIKPIIKKNGASVFVMGAANEYEPQKYQAMKNVISKTVEDMEKHQVPTEQEYYFGSKLADAVIEKSRKLRSDLIVITTTFNRSVKQFFVGSYTRKIANNNNTPVLCIKPYNMVLEDYDMQMQLKTPSLS